MKKYVLKDADGNYYKGTNSLCKDPVIITKNIAKARTFGTRGVPEDLTWVLSMAYDHKFKLEELM